VRGRKWSHYAAPAAFLLAVTVAVLLVRSALQTDATTTSAVIPTLPQRTSTKPATTQRATTTKRTPPSTQRFYTVVAGDTFAVIASKTGVPVARIQQLNPNVESTALFIGQKLRIR
jgi:LysM repeat protein